MNDRDEYETRVNYSRGSSRRRHVAGRQSNRDDRTHAHMRAIVPMLVMVVTVFILCWSPILVFEVET